MNTHAITQDTFDKLPRDIQNEIQSTLRVFAKCHVTYERGEYHVSAGIAITKTYADDHKFIGTAYQDDFYSIDERDEIFEQEYGYRQYHPKEWYEKQKAAEAGKHFIKKRREV